MLDHTVENTISICAASIGTLGIVIVDPGVDDDLTLLVITEKQPVLLEELGAEPVLMLITQSGTLSKIRSGRVPGDDIKRQSGNGGQLFGGVLLDVPFRVFPAQALYFLQEIFQLLEKERVSENGPAIDDQGIAGSQS